MQFVLFVSVCYFYSKLKKLQKQLVKFNIFLICGYCDLQFFKMVTNRTGLKDESSILRTFQIWPYSHIVSPEKLTRAGFFYLNYVDVTKCAFCDGITANWEVGDDLKHFPSCPYVKSVILPRLQWNEFTKGSIER